MRKNTYNKMFNKTLDEIAEEIKLKTVKDFTYSDNRKDLNEEMEIEGYEKIISYFWTNARTRLRENETNEKYLNRINQRLSEIKETNKHLSGLCSHLISRISKCNLE